MWRNPLRREDYRRQLAERPESFTLGWSYGPWLFLGEVLGNTAESDPTTLALAEAARQGRVLAALHLLDRLQEVGRDDEAVQLARHLDDADIDVPAELLV